MVARPGETNAAKDAAFADMSIRMTKETTPLWVWLSVALLAIGTLAYVMAVYLVEHIIGILLARRTTSLSRPPAASGAAVLRRQSRARS